jgi:hypothetical protein
MHPFAEALPAFGQGDQIILGIVRTLEFEQISDFLLTLHKTGYQGTVGFFCDDISQRTLEKFRAMNLLLRDFHEIRLTIPFTGKKINAYRIASPLARFWFMLADKKQQFSMASSAYHIHQSRHFLYTAFLEEKGHLYKHIMLSDTRDVVFQRNPFDFPIENSLCCFLEDPSTHIIDEKHNAGWIRRAFGEQTLHEIGHNPISCAGITMGSTQAIYNYTSHMCNLLLQPRIRAIAGITGLDQGIHNYAVRTGILGPEMKLFENEKGPVLTMGLMKNKDIKKDNSGRLINSDGSIVHTIHQYDRHPGLVKELPRLLLN